jgi:hypothetical protein
LNAKRKREKRYKYVMKLITTLMRIHELNTPQKYEKRERERELEKKDSIKKNHYMQ